MRLTRFEMISAFLILFYSKYSNNTLMKKLLLFRVIVIKLKPEQWPSRVTKLKIMINLIIFV